MKTCTKCGETKPLDAFVSHKECVGGRANTCKACRLAAQREARKRDGNIHTRRYEKSRVGFIMRAYRNMKSRVEGIQAQKAHLYAGKPILSKAEFYAWAILSDEFNRLFDEWERSGYDRKLTPSVDRINSAGGYEIANMRWLTHSENSRLGAVSRFGLAA